MTSRSLILDHLEDAVESLLAAVLHMRVYPQPLVVAEALADARSHLSAARRLRKDRMAKKQPVQRHAAG